MKYFFALTIIILIQCWIGLGQSEACPKYWVDAQHLNMGCILFNDTVLMTATETELFCQSLPYTDVHMVEVVNAEQHNFLVRQAQLHEFYSGSSSFWWLGISDELEEGKWIWTHSKREATFTAWQTPCGQPDCGTSCNAAYMNPGCVSELQYGWDDVASYYYGAPMCQFNDQVTPTSTPAPTTTDTPTHTCDDIPCDHGNGFYPQGDCNKCFCQCHDGYQDEICCAEGLVFDPVGWRCDFPFNVDSC